MSMAIESDEDVDVDRCREHRVRRKMSMVDDVDDGRCCTVVDDSDRLGFICFLYFFVSHRLGISC